MPLRSRGIQEDEGREKYEIFYFRKMNAIYFQFIYATRDRNMKNVNLFARAPHGIY